MNFSMMSRKDLIIMGSAVVLLLIIAFGASRNGGTGTETTQNGVQNASSSESTGASASTTATTTPAQKPAAPSLSYTQAVNLYAGRRIQFDQNCAMSPNGMVVRNGTNIMFDNRAPFARSIYLDRKEFKLSAYGYRVILLSYKAVPHTVVVDCGTGRNTGTILVQ